MRHRAARISFSLDPTGSWEVVGEETVGISRHAPGLGSRCFQLGGIVIRHGGYAGGGDTTLGLYKLHIVAVEECLFAPELRLAAPIEKLHIDHLEIGTDSSTLSLFTTSSHKPDPVSGKYAASRLRYSGSTRWSDQRRCRSQNWNHRHPVLHGVHIRYRSMPLCPANGRRRDMRSVESRAECLL